MRMLRGRLRRGCQELKGVAQVLSSATWPNATDSHAALAGPHPARGAGGGWSVAVQNHVVGQRAPRYWHF